MSGQRCEWTKDDNENAMIQSDLDAAVEAGVLAIVGKSDGGQDLYQITEYGRRTIAERATDGK